VRDTGTHCFHPGNPLIWRMVEVLPMIHHFGTLLKPFVAECDLCRYSTKVINVRFQGEEYYDRYSICAVHLEKVREEQRQLSESNPEQKSQREVSEVSDSSSDPAA
jgi:hypothetical protein